MTRAGLGQVIQSQDQSYTLGPAGTTGTPYGDGQIIGPAAGYSGEGSYTGQDVAEGVIEGVQTGSNAIRSVTPSTSTLTWVVVGLASVAAIVVLGPLVWEWTLERRVSQAVR